MAEIRRSPVEEKVVYLIIYDGFEHHPNGGWEFGMGFQKHQQHDDLLIASGCETSPG